MKHLLETPEFAFVIAYFRSIDFTDRRKYANWLAQTYYFVSHSVRLSALGASALDIDDPLSKRMVAHTKEESGHHLLARRDIEALGGTLSEFPRLGVTGAFYQSQYYKVLFEHPSHLVGQILMLEAVSVELGSWLLGIVEPAFGRDACRFVEVHAREDRDHVRKALDALNELAAENQRGVQTNFMQACEMYFFILRSLNEQSFADIVRHRPTANSALQPSDTQIESPL